ncbi:hypothetical protein ACFU6S_28360 [Streptomyces sp. NPDC057456]|uniref:hypothetical protein n=1 Tax=Streptomyces sp. NPDC057456 TaxID=3346139 RepID=UPI0036CA4AAB
MRARTDSDTQDDIHDGPQAETTGPTGAAGRTETAAATEQADDADADTDDDADDEHGPEDARRARWTAIGTGALLTLAGLAASLMRLTGSAPALVPAAYAVGAAVCALAALLGSRGRTRRALWLLIAGVMVMAIGDQAD